MHFFNMKSRNKVKNLLQNRLLEFQNNFHLLVVEPRQSPFLGCVDLVEKIYDSIIVKKKANSFASSLNLSISIVELESNSY